MREWLANVNEITLFLYKNNHYKHITAEISKKLTEVAVLLGTP